jgi:F0F1-type ATP synthase assembly protein I
MGPFFEQHPWGLIVLIIVTVEGWQLLKATVSGIVRRMARHSHSVND